ncbi:MAG TPA: hypothetical protein VGN14_10775 [Candidatus Elarobacter sp.]|jgi:hypothetical protein
MSTITGERSGVPLYDPRGEIRAEHRALSPRIAALDGLRVAVLDNTKWNGWKLLNRTMELLGDDHRFASVTRYKKESFSSVADEALIARIAAENDIALTGIGD